jgi:hypothetical protein
MLREGQVLVGPQFSEPMVVETVRAYVDTWVVGLVGEHTRQFRRVTLTRDDLQAIRILDRERRFDGDGQLLRLGIEAYRLGIAYEFDPYFGLSISRVDPLPHPLEAVYGYLLKPGRVLFLLADDAGAGKTIMAGLLLRELKLRGLVERTLVVCPANLTFQWQRELKEKFGETFLVLKGGDIREQFGVNQWQEHPQIVTSLDLAKREDILPGLRQVEWDLVVVDEAHRMSASDPDHKTQRYRLGELLRDRSDHLVLLTATPHKGDPVNFPFFLQLLDQDAFADVRSIREAMERRRAPFYLRRTKEAMVYFPEHRPDGTWVTRKIFTRRIPHTVDFRIDVTELDLYRDVTRFVKRQSAAAAAREGDPRARVESTPRGPVQLELLLEDRVDEAGADYVPRGRGRGRRPSPDPLREGEGEHKVTWGATTLDRVHTAMLLQAAGRANALRALLRSEVERGPDFLRLANALAALYPKGSEERRLVEAMLLAVPR